MASDPTEPEYEYEHGVAIPGRILPQSEWAKTAVKRLPEPGPLDWAAVFGRVAPVVLDLGCGNGRYTLASALARPDHDHFSIDVLPVVIRYATRRANQRGLANVRFAVKDAQTFLASYVGNGSIAEIHLYHPQPFHDARKAHLRVLTPETLARVHCALVAVGLVRGPDRQSRLLALHVRSAAIALRFPGSCRTLARLPRRPHPPRDHRPPARPDDLPRHRDPAR